MVGLIVVSVDQSGGGSRALRGWGVNDVHNFGKPSNYDKKTLTVPRIYDFGVWFVFHPRRERNLAGVWRQKKKTISSTLHTI